jgi:hypothetical protein
MSFLKGKLAQRLAAGLSAVALVVAIALPGTAFGQSITINRCPANGTGGPSPLCTRMSGVPAMTRGCYQHGFMERATASAGSAVVVWSRPG